MNLVFIDLQANCTTNSEGKNEKKIHNAVGGGVEMFLLIFFVICIGVSPTYSQNIETTYLCPKDFQVVAEKCYHISTQEFTWQDSHFYCQILNSTLAVIDSQRKKASLRDFTLSNNSINSAPGRSERWIDGIYDWEQKKWKWGTSGEFITFNVFSRKKIGDNNKWKCIAVDGAKRNKWRARKCTDKKQILCEVEPVIFVEFKVHVIKKKGMDLTKCSSGEKLEEYEIKKCLQLLGSVQNNEAAAYARKPKPAKRKAKRKKYGWVCPQNMISLGSRCYFFSTTETTWTDAHFECRKNNSKLAVIRNRSQDHNLRRFLNNFIERQDRWIGGIFDWKIKKWKWAMTGQLISYKGFSPESIKNKTISDLSWTAIFMDPKLDNQWNAEKQTMKKHFICQVSAKSVKKFKPVIPKHPNDTINSSVK